MSGWGSWLSGGDANAAAAPNFHAVTDREQNALFGPLGAKDLEWTCAGGFTTETQTWYTILEDGSFATSQVIHSSVGLWYPQVQITFKYFNPKTGERVWKSVNVSKFASPATAGSGRDKDKVYDKRSCKGEQFTILFDTLPDGSEKYTIEANMDTDLQVSYSFTRPAKSVGWKLGAGEQGGKSFFGANTASPDGYVIHRFWPLAVSEGHIIRKGQAIDAKGAGMFVHAIQGMRPNLVASRWNFANFQSKTGSGEDVTAIMMEFTTTGDYGGPVGSRTIQDPSTGNTIRKREPVVVNIGSVMVGGELVAVTGASRGLTAADSTPSKGSDSRVHHLNATKDSETGYDVPQAIKYTWQGPKLNNGKVSSEQVQAEVSVELGKPSPTSESKGLIEKVDILGEIPYMVRKMVNYVAGTKPYIYQYLNPATLKIKLPSKELDVSGNLYVETTFISEP